MAGIGRGLTVESVKIDLRVGGKFRIQTKRTDGEFFTAAGTYLEVKRPCAAGLYLEKDGGGSEFGDLEGQETQVAVEFHERKNQTELVLTHEKFESVDLRDRHREGWENWIGRLAEFLEIKKAVTKTNTRNGYEDTLLRGMRLRRHSLRMHSKTGNDASLSLSRLPAIERRPVFVSRSRAGGSFQAFARLTTLPCLTQ
jgi:uncharacterized protein YndB with AHSA1/START domain